MHGAAALQPPALLLPHLHLLFIQVIAKIKVTLW
jgi:hypothetical protein